jgi:hypothetical protein
MILLLQFDTHVYRKWPWKYHIDERKDCRDNPQAYQKKVVKHYQKHFVITDSFPKFGILMLAFENTYRPNISYWRQHLAFLVGLCLHEGGFVTVFSCGHLSFFQTELVEFGLQTFW